MYNVYLFCIGFSKTFDVVNQRILLNKPEHCVIRCQAHASFEKNTIYKANGKTPMSDEAYCLFYGCTKYSFPMKMKAC